MGNYEQLKQAVSDVIKTNGNQEITGEIMQNVLLTIISKIGNNATFAGIATPTTNPGTPDQNVFYIASENGIYSNFDGIEINNEVAIIRNSNGKWAKLQTGIISVSQHDNLIIETIGKIKEGYGIRGDNGTKFKSKNFSNIEFPVKSGVEYVSNVPYQNGYFGIAFYNEVDEYVGGTVYNINSNYINLPLYIFKFIVPQNAIKAKATIFNSVNRANGRYSFFIPIINQNNIINIVGIGDNAEAANAINNGDIYYKSNEKKFRKKIDENLFVDIETNDETIIIYKDFLFNGFSNFEKGYFSNNIQLINLSLYPKFIDNGVINYNDGTVFTDNVSSSRCENYIPCKGITALTISMSPGNIPSSIAGIAFYNKNFDYISGVQRPTMFYSNKSKIYIIPPKNAVFFRTTYFNSDKIAQKGEFECFGVYNEIAVKEILLDYRDIVDGVGVIVDKTGGGYIEPIGNVYTTSLLGASSYINCKGALYMDITFPVLTSAPTQGLVFFDNLKNSINGIVRLKGVSNGIQTIRIYIPDNAETFKTTFWNFENSITYGEFSCKMYFFDDGVKYRPYQNELIFFSEKINQSVNIYWDDTNEIVNPIEYKATTGVLLLPDNYKPVGKPFPVIMYCHGFSHGVWYGTWGSTENFLLQKRKWASMGFAVFDCNGARNNDRQVNFTGAGSIQFVTAYRKCFEYIKEHYNVESSICVIGGSAGGPTGINFCYLHSGLVKKCALLSAWSDLKTCSWGQGVRNTFVEYLGFNNTTDYEEEKTIGYDPAKRIIDISGVEMCNYPVSVKAWIGSTENGHVLYTALYRFINALRNAGNSAYIREVQGLTHTDVVSGNNDVVDTEVASWFLL